MASQYQGYQTEPVAGRDYPAPSQATSPPRAASPPGTFGALMDRLKFLTDRAVASRSRIAHVRDRLAGTSPEKGGPGNLKAVASGFIDEFDEQLGVLDRVLTDLENDSSYLAEKVN